jgi:hypothetical protein
VAIPAVGDIEFSKTSRQIKDVIKDWKKKEEHAHAESCIGNSGVFSKCRVE